MDGVGALAYAVTQSAARALLWELGLNPIDDALDILLREYCQGFSSLAWKPRGPRRCLAVSPPLVAVHWRAGSLTSDSDNLAPEAQGEREKAYTQNIRWSVKLNMEELINGGTDLVDQYPDSVQSVN